MMGTCNSENLIDTVFQEWSSLLYGVLDQIIVVKIFSIEAQCSCLKYCSKMFLIRVQFSYNILENVLRLSMFLIKK